MIHYCPQCAQFSYHGDDSFPSALLCPNCAHVSRQRPHPPARSSQEIDPGDTPPPPLVGWSES